MLLEDFKKIQKNMPDTPGVYFFLGPKKPASPKTSSRGGEVLYIGKATSLRDRVRSYFAGDLIVTRGPLLVEMLGKASTVDWRETDSVLEALLLEANLIRSHQPTFNTMMKDDKSFNYVVITKEDFPRVLVVRGRNLEEEYPEDERLHIFGPFPHGLQLREAMKLIRKIFPYRDSCVPASELIAARKPASPKTSSRGGKPKACFNRHIGLCPGICSGEISKEEYRRIIRHIALLFQGKKKELIKSLEREMKQAAKEENFEEAARMRSQVFALNHIQDISLIKEEHRRPKLSLGVARLEAYDIAHLRGEANVGVMTVVEDGVAMKQEYRKFKIRKAKPGDDPGALKEILSRRLEHEEWPLPRLIIVDGSTAQLNAAGQILDQYGMTIPIVGVVKDEKHRPRDIRGDRDLIAGRERDILLANAEAHRFAISYHRRKSRTDRNIIARSAQSERTIR